MVLSQVTAKHSIQLSYQWLAHLRLAILKTLLRRNQTYSHHYDLQIDPTAPVQPAVKVSDVSLPTTALLQSEVGQVK